MRSGGAGLWHASACGSSAAGHCRTPMACMSGKPGSLLVWCAGSTCLSAFCYENCEMYKMRGTSVLLCTTTHSFLMDGFSWSLPCNLLSPSTKPRSAVVRCSIAALECAARVLLHSAYFVPGAKFAFVVGDECGRALMNSWGCYYLVSEE